MTPELRAFLTEMHNDIRDVKLSVLGDEKLGQKGLIKRTERLEMFAFVLLLIVAAVIGLPKLVDLLKAVV